MTHHHLAVENPVLPAEQEKRSPVPRAKHALQTVAEVVVPTAFVGAGYLVAGSHWYAFKGALAAQGIPAEVAALAAPVVAVIAVLGLRHFVRLAFSPPETLEDAEDE